MFDIGFTELLVIGLVGLIVIGPDKLPETIRTAAMWLGRAKRTYARFRQDLEQEIGADEIRRELHNETIMADLKRAKQDIDQSLNSSADGTDTPQQTPLKPPTSKPE